MNQVAIFAAGCFWGVEATFRTVEGVLTTAVGYTGGAINEPTYQHVCTGKTGHAEAVQITYDPRKVSYGELVELFWASHDPTQLNRQGPDVGTQYRSAIFYTTPDQEETARASKAEQDAAGRFAGPIVTHIAPAENFWRAEEYHQQYLAKRGQDACSSTVR